MEPLRFEKSSRRQIGGNTSSSGSFTMMDNDKNDTNNCLDRGGGGSSSGDDAKVAAFTPSSSSTITLLLDNGEEEQYPPSGDLLLSRFGPNGNQNYRRNHGSGSPLSDGHGVEGMATSVSPTISKTAEAPSNVDTHLKREDRLLLGKLDDGEHDHHYHRTAGANGSSSSSSKDATTVQTADTYRRPAVLASTESDIGAAAVAAPSREVEIIDLLDLDDEEEEGGDGEPMNDGGAKRQKLVDPSSGPASPPSSRRVGPLSPRPSTFATTAMAVTSAAVAVAPPPPRPLSPVILEYVPFPPGFQPNWLEIMPPPPGQQLSTSGSLAAASASPPAFQQPRNHRYYRLSLLNVNEFTITGLPPHYDAPPTSITGLRVPIRKIARDHGGKAVYDTGGSGIEDEGVGESSGGGGAAASSSTSGVRTGGGRWRIPLGAYQAFYGWLSSEPNTRVDGISSHQLQIASLERARQERGYPSADDLVLRGVPRDVAMALAPFQRGGVDFVIDKGGRALIADDMGLGKTIQGIASMAVYMEEWPLLVLCPSSARFHWEGEFQRWLALTEGERLRIDDDTNDTHPVLHPWQINVQSSAKAAVLPLGDTKVVICTYGLALALLRNGKLASGMFGCAIVDESHSLKNKSSKRSKALVPFLSSIPRCVLLSGTPALARPAELWPQLEILRVSGQNGFWDNEADFLEKYVRRGGSTEKAELHTMLTGTIMIRRLKNEILKDLPRKCRSQALIHILTSDQCREFKSLLALLRKSNGTLGNFAREHHASQGESSEEPGCLSHASVDNSTQSNARAGAERALLAESNRLLQEGRLRIHESLSSVAFQLSVEQRNSLLIQQEGELKAVIDKQFIERSAALDVQLGELSRTSAQDCIDAETKRTTLLSHMYGLTGDCKIPLVVDMLRRWLADPTKGKLCIFAHHLSVLNAIRDQAELSNVAKSNKKFIRIDGATLPRQRQEQIKLFQTDPSVRVALLGITAAGVAVTLTASSTVWFAELFWTPALMIQAEDRCHRIGQQARVNCLYFVARGTLDEILWKLIEKKFQDLGEFVEGKEKMKMVVENVFHSEKELHAMFNAGEDDEDDAACFDDETGFDKELMFDDLAEDIAKLGEEECAMLRIDSDDDEEGGTSEGKIRHGSRDTGKVAAVELQGEEGRGKSEADAIELLDDDDDDDDEEVRQMETKANAESSESSGATAGNITVASSQKSTQNVFAQAASGQVNFSMGYRMYKLRIVSPTLGVKLGLHQGRPLVVRITSERTGKPDIGDILIGINGWPLPLTQDIETIIERLRVSLRRLPAEITFAEYPLIRKSLLALQEGQARAALRESQNRAAAENVIEINDDDDDD